MLLEFPAPVKVASLFITGHADRIPMTEKLEASADGKSFRKLAALSSLAESSRTEASFPETTARYFRITAAATSKKSGKLAISRIEFAGPRLSDIVHKAGYRQSGSVEFSKDVLPAVACISPGSIVDLTDKLGADGKLAWNVPDGNWTIVRIGHTSTGQQNAPAPDSGRGLECDKMSRAAVESHFEGMMGKVIADAGPLAGKTLKMVLADSWEAGCQNWTPAMRDEF